MGRNRYGQILGQSNNPHHLQLASALLPLRLACSGGTLEGKLKKQQVSALIVRNELQVEKGAKKIQDEHGNETEHSAQTVIGHEWSQAELEGSDVTFRSKFDRLLQELQYIRDTEPGCELI